MVDQDGFKLKSLMKNERKSAFQVYKNVVYGNIPLLRVFVFECMTFFLGGLPGALGLFLRSKLYPLMFKEVRGKLVVGKNVTIRHAHKITLGAGVILDDNSVLDAKGESNSGISVGDSVYVGRNTIIYCKNGDMDIGDFVNFSSNCQVFSSNKLTFKAGSVIGAYSYFLSGGEYDMKDATPYAQQSGMCTKGSLTIGENVWIGARVTVLDAANVGDHCVIGAGSVVNKAVDSGSVAVGVPAKVIGQSKTNK